ncbi:MAG: hypothetical protein ACYS0I_00400 [Planctomycetota bacterium]|jgi:serine/threonine protein kinase
MPLPSEYVIEDAVRSIGDVIVYRANHTIHGTVNVYLPDDNLPPELARIARKRLYQNGLQMRNISLLNIPCATKALEVSQNPNEPYIVTKYAEHDLENFISNGVIIKPKRMFKILSQILQTIVDLAVNGWVIDRLHPRQVKLSQSHTGDISLTVIEGAAQQIDVFATTPTADDKPIDAVKKTKPQPVSKEDRIPDPTATNVQRIGEMQTTKDATATAYRYVDRESFLDGSLNIKDARRQLRIMQRNIYTLGNMTYQLLFGRKYESNDKVTLTDIQKLPRRWRKILDKVLSNNVDCRYDTYQMMLRDVKRALNRNKRVAVASIPFLLLLAVIGSYFAYERYRRHKIMTSEAGQAIKSFLDIVNKTNDEFPTLEKPKPEPPKPDEQTILEPFDKIEPIRAD